MFILQGTKMPRGLTGPLCPPFCSGPTTVRAVPSDPIRSLIADAMKPPNAFIPAPLVQKEAHTGYSYQQINCLDSIIR